jgi:hypothetical protein
LKNSIALHGLLVLGAAEKVQSGEDFHAIRFEQAEQLLNALSDRQSQFRSAST